MKCLDCKFRDVIENGAKGFIGETIINCKLCNEINGDMKDCKDFEPKEDKP